MRAGTGDAQLDRRLDRLLAEGDYLLVTADTSLGLADSVPRPVLVVDATLILEGAVAGDLVGVDANLFLRPSARVHGDVVNVAGGLYRSKLAETGGATVDEPLAPYRVARTGGTLRIEGRRETAALDLDGVLGFDAPTYDRVDALGVRWSAGYDLPPLGRATPRVRGIASYRSGRGALQGGGELSLLRGRNALALGFVEATETNDDWIRGDLKNSGAFVLKGRDYRNYYEVERRYLEASRRFGNGRRALRAFARGQLEQSSSLGAGDPWTIFDEDSVRPNPPIDDGRITSAIVGAAVDWTWPTALVEADASLELAGDLLGGDFSFGRFLVQGEWEMLALADHVLELEWRFQGPLPGTGTLPRQRWSFVGGSGTLQTFELAQFRGDRLAYLETEYIIPLPERLRLPILGPPDLHLIHIAGMAWTDAEERDLEQNVGIRLQFVSPYVRIMTNPERPTRDLDLDFGLSWPFGNRRPWERRD